jgi:hypothetical protein
MKKVYKINKAQLQEMIQKETLRQKRILDLKSKRESILKQLNEMYELEGEVEEGTCYTLWVLLASCPACQMEATRHIRKPVLQGVASKDAKRTGF